MIVDLNAIIRNKNSNLTSRLTYEVGYLNLNIDGYKLQNHPSLYQHWKISEHSFAESGNKLGFELTGFNNEITNFELEFKVKIPMLRNNGLYDDAEFTFQIKYHEFKQEITVYNPDKTIEIHEKSDLEEVFKQLIRVLSGSNTFLKSCFSCALSGYEKGGATLFCFKKSRNQFLSKTYLEQYQNHFKGLETELVTEFYHCNEFEIDARKIKA